MVDVARDGSRFLMMRRIPEVSEAAIDRIAIVENFTEEVRQRLRGR